MRDALAMTAAALQAVARGAGVKDMAQIRFTGEWAHLPPMSVGQILDQANELLALPTAPCNCCGQDFPTADHPDRHNPEREP